MDYLLTEEEVSEVVVACIEDFNLLREKVPHHDSALTGDMYFREIVNSRSTARFLDCVR